MNSENLLQKIEYLEQTMAVMSKKIATLEKSRFRTFINAFPRKRLIVLFAGVVISISAIIYATTITTLNTFSAGSTIVAEDVNDNFQYLYERVSPVGSITMHGAAAAPTGWLLCDGRTVSRAEYAALFAVIGTTFGIGDGATNFNLPDFRGVFPKGAGTTTRELGKDANGNFYTGILGTYATDKMQGFVVAIDHDHGSGNTSTVGDHQHYVDGDTVGGSYLGGIFSVDSHTNQLNFRVSSPAGSHSHTFDMPAYYGDSGNPKSDGANGTPRTGMTTEPQSLGIHFIIKY